MKSKLLISCLWFGALLGCVRTTAEIPCSSNSECLSQQCFQGFCTEPTADGGGIGSDTNSASASGVGPTHSGCVNLECRQVLCTNGKKTTLTGKVFDPSGTLPLFNAVVYVPNAALEPFAPGVSCDRCGATPSGAPLVSTATGADGTFTLKDVPAGANVPLVIQLGRWRRQVVLKYVEACTATALTDPNLTRLPRNQGEGEIPKMAIATGSADPFECLLKKIGLDDAEITRPSGTGRVHFYRQNGVDLSPPAPAARELWSDINTLKQYDVVMLPCEGSQKLKPMAATQNLIDYSNAGGRVFTTHFSYVWIDFAQTPWPGTGDWNPGNVTPPDPYTGSMDTSFPKGSAFLAWLGHVGATNGGTLEINEARHDLNSVKAPLAQRWIFGANPNDSMSPNVQHMTFNTPIDGPAQPDGGAPLECGRVVFSDFHLTAGAKIAGLPFPASCRAGPLTPQEKALVFMLFDLSACVQPDRAPLIH